MRGSGRRLPCAFLHPPLAAPVWSLAASSPRQAEQGDLAASWPSPGLGTWLPPGDQLPPGGQEGPLAAAPRPPQPHECPQGSSLSEQRDFAGDFRRSLLVCAFFRGTENLVLFIPSSFNLGVGFFWTCSARSEVEAPNSIREIS